jgi:hypothetical protein
MNVTVAAAQPMINETESEPGLHHTTNARTPRAKIDCNQPSSPERHGSIRAGSYTRRTKLPEVLRLPSTPDVLNMKPGRVNGATVLGCCRAVITSHGTQRTNHGVNMHLDEWQHLWIAVRIGLLDQRKSFVAGPPQVIPELIKIHDEHCSSCVASLYN